MSSAAVLYEVKANTYSVNTKPFPQGETEGKDLLCLLAFCFLAVLQVILFGMYFWSDALFNTHFWIINIELTATVYYCAWWGCFSSRHGSIPAVLGSASSCWTSALHTGHLEWGHYQEKHKSAENVAKTGNHTGSSCTVSERQGMGFFVPCCDVHSTVTFILHSACAINMAKLLCASVVRLKPVVTTNRQIHR